MKKRTYSRKETFILLYSLTLTLQIEGVSGVRHISVWRQTPTHMVTFKNRLRNLKLTSIVIQLLFRVSWFFVSHLMVAGSLKFHYYLKLTMNQISKQKSKFQGY